MARYWAARELTRIERDGDRVKFHAPFACPSFTIQVSNSAQRVPAFAPAGRPGAPLRQVERLIDLKEATWFRRDEMLAVCFDLPRGRSELKLG